MKLCIKVLSVALFLNALSSFAVTLPEPGKPVTCTSQYGNSGPITITISNQGTDENGPFISSNDVSSLPMKVVSNTDQAIVLKGEKHYDIVSYNYSEVSLSQNPNQNYAQAGSKSLMNDTGIPYYLSNCKNAE